MERGDDALTELLHLGLAQNVPELRLADQENLQQRPVVALEIREHSQLLKGARGKVLHLVDDKKAAGRAVCRLVEKLLDLVKKGGLVIVGAFDAELGRHDPQQVDVLETAADDPRGRPGAVDQPRQEVVDQGRLAGADLARDDHEALALAEPVAGVSEGLLVRALTEEEPGIRRDLKRQLFQIVEGFIHCAPASLPPPFPVARLLSSWRIALRSSSHLAQPLPCRTDDAAGHLVTSYSDSRNCSSCSSRRSERRRSAAAPCSGRSRRPDGP